MATTSEASLRARSLLRLGTAVLAAASATLAASLAAWAATWAAQEGPEGAAHSCTASRTPATAPPPTQPPPRTRTVGCPPQRHSPHKPPTSTRRTTARTTSTRTSGPVGSRMTGAHRKSSSSERKSTGAEGSGSVTSESHLKRRPAPSPTTPATTDPDSTARAWPVSAPPPVLRGWEPPATPYGPGHRGIDLGASEGTVVRAAAAGRVVFAGPVGGRGVVSVELPGTGSPPLRTTYEPVVASVRKGDVVEAGQPLGVLDGADAYHCGTPCLHWGLRRGKTYLNPLSLLPPELLGLGPSRLYPPTGPLPQPQAPHSGPGARAGTGASADPAAHPLLRSAPRHVARPVSVRQPVSPPPAEQPVPVAPAEQPVSASAGRRHTAARPHAPAPDGEEVTGRHARREGQVSRQSRRAERGRRPRRRSSPAPRRHRTRSGARRHRRHLGGASPQGAAPRGRGR